MCSQNAPQPQQSNLFCCNEEERLLKGYSFLERLSVHPELLIFRKFQKCRTYKQTFQIKNEDINPVRIELSSNFPSDLKFRIDANCLQIFPQLTTSVDVFFESNESTKRWLSENRRHSIYITVRHPNLTIEYPILVCSAMLEVRAPKQIFFPKCTKDVTSYYSMVVFNPNVNKKNNVWKKSPQVKLLSKITEFAPKSCSKLHFRFTPKTHSSISDELIIFYDRKQLITFSNEVESYKPFISDKTIRFPKVSFGCSSDVRFLICNESLETVKIKWCKRSKKPETAGSEKNCSEPDEPSNVKQITESFSLMPKSGTIKPKSSIEMRARFRPTLPSSITQKEDLIYPLKLKSCAYLAFSSTNEIRTPVTLTGVGLGPEVILNFCHLELGSIVLGEKRIVRVKAKNSGTIPAMMHFCGSDGKFGGVAKASPESFSLDPGDEKVFVIEYYSTVLGKFMEKLIFNIVNGSTVKMIISGVVKPIQVKVKPESLDFGQVNICSLLKKNLTITNPLSVPIIVSNTTENDGVQEPLIISNFHEYVQKSIDANEVDCDDDYEVEQSELIQQSLQSQYYTSNSAGLSIATTTTTPSQISFESDKGSADLVDSARSLSVKSSGFLDLIDKGSEIARKCVNTATAENIADDPHPDLRILNTVIDKLLIYDYFEPLNQDRLNALKTMAIPKIPREYILNPQPFLIDAFQSITLPVFLVPNKIGRVSVLLNLRVSIYDGEKDGAETLSRNKMAMPENTVTTAVILKHNCIVPELDLPDVLEFATYLDLPTKFNFKVTNLLKVSGIFTITLDKSRDAEATVIPAKSVIKPLQTVDCALSITSRVAGKHKITGNVEIFGSNKPKLITFLCNATAPEVKISPNSLVCEVKVMQSKMCMTCISNQGVSLVQYKAYLKYGTSITCSPTEGIINPKACEEIILTIICCDPGEYKDILYIEVKHIDAIKVQIQVTAKGLPMLFTPDLRKDLNLQSKSISNHPLIIPITIKNCGKDSYKMFITKKEKPSDQVESSTFSFEETSINVGGGESHETKSILYRPKTMLVKEEFRVDAIVAATHRRIRDFVFVCEVNLICSKLKWNKPKLCFEFKNSDFCETTLEESVTITNTSDIVEDIELIAVGNFQIFDSEKQQFSKNLQLQLRPQESNELVICFEVCEINKWNTDIMYEGKIIARSPDTTFKPLLLQCKIVFPIISLPRKSLLYYSMKSPFVASFDIENTGELLAFYQWSHQSVPAKHSIVKKTNLNWITIADFINSNEIKGIYKKLIDVENEFLISFRKSLDYDLKDQNDLDEGEEVESDGTNATPSPKEKKQPSKKGPLAEKFKKRPSKKKTATSSKTNITKLSKVQKSSKSDNTSITSKSASKEESKVESEIEIVAVDFIANESQLEVKFDEMIEQIKLIFENSKDQKYCTQSSEEFTETAKLLDVERSLREKSEMYFLLDHYRGSLKPETKKTMNIYFVGEPEDVEITTTLIMDVVGGKSERLDISVVNCKAEIEVSQTDFDLDVQPWHTVVYRKVKLKNFNDNPVQLKTVGNVYQNKENRLYKGFVTTSPSDLFYLQPGAVMAIDAFIYLGINNRFCDGFGIELNKNIPVSIQFRGNGMIPMVSVLNLERLQSEDMSIDQEYKHLNEIYLQHIRHVKPIKKEVTDEEITELKRALGIQDSVEEFEGYEESTLDSASTQERSGKKFKVSRKSKTTLIQSSTLSSQSIGESERDSIEPEALKLFKPTIQHLIITSTNTIGISRNLQPPKFRAVVLQSADSDLSEYNVLDYPEEYPCVVQLQHLLDAQKFLYAIQNTKSVEKRFREIIDRFVLPDLKTTSTVKPKKYQRPIKPTSFVMQPLPFHSSTYRLNLGTMYFDRTVYNSLDLFNHGPGKVNFSVRTLVPIPGMEIAFLEPDFNCNDEPEEFKFSIFNKTLLQKPDWVYRNVKIRCTEGVESTRSVCGECGMELCHAHSYDFNSQIVHTREINARARKSINELYSWWSRPVREIKDPNIHCEIFQERISDAKNKMFKLSIKFKPTRKFYKDSTEFLDYLYIDIHLGPTIPILLEGTIKSLNTETESLEGEEAEAEEDYNFVSPTSEI